LLRCNAEDEVEPCSKNPIAVVHAYADGPYDRSSFHIAGRSDFVALVAADLADSAIQKMSKENKIKEEEEESSRHPFVGLVDHVSIMPLSSQPDKKETDAAGRAARFVGERLSTAGVEVCYYGSADPPNYAPLADVRRNRTRFFQSGSIQGDESSNSTSRNKELGVATVGAPPQFVENCNVLLSPKCSWDVARSLTRTLRHRNKNEDGIVGVEALTLPYSHGRFEAACNLLEPQIGTREEIERRVAQWAHSITSSNTIENDHDMDPVALLVERIYRVGTTANQCEAVLHKDWSQRSASFPKEIDNHDEQVYLQFIKYINTPL
jgi:hypothetical protein